LTLAHQHNTTIDYTISDAQEFDVPEATADAVAFI